MEPKQPNSRQANEDLGLGVLDVNIALGNLRRRVLGLEQPAKLGRYELLRRLGSGAMGVVYLARDPTLDREVAIKQLHSQLADSSAAARAERHMQREAWAMARLTHQNVVAVYEFGAEGERFYIVMEFVPGLTLRAWMDAEPNQPWATVLELLVGAGRGLAAAHEAGLIHRDFKPQNVLIDADARVAKVTDFGLASPVGERFELDAQALDDGLQGPLDDSFALSIDGVVLGTPAYMAPECHAGQAADARSDQFSFCVTLYEALFGERPFAGSSYAELASAVRAGNRRPLPRARSVPPWIVAALERGLAVEPEQRWPSMSTLLDALCDDPRGRRRRRVWTTATVACVITLVGALALVRRGVRAHQIATCAAEGETIAEVWNPTSRAGIEASAPLDGPEYGGETIENVVVALDDYARQWSDVRAQLCVATEVEHSLNPELARRARQCLDARRSWMGLLIEAFPETEGLAMLRVVRILTHLPESEICLDPAYLRGLPELPEIYEQAQRELSVTFLRAELARSLYRGDEAIALLEAAFADAEALGWPPLIAEVSFELGRGYTRIGRIDRGVQLIEQAYFIAVEHDLDALAVHSASWLAEGADANQAEQWMRHARVALARIERPAADLLAYYEHQSMVVAMLSEDNQRAVEIGEPLLLRSQAQLGDGHRDVQNTRITLAFAYQHVGRHEDALATFQTALAAERRWFGTRRVFYKRILIGLADAERAMGNIAEARRVLEQARAAYEEGPLTPAFEGIYLMLGAVCEEAGQLADARDYYARDLDTQRDWFGAEHPLIGELHERQARILIALGERALALEHYEAAIEIRVGREQLEAAQGLLDAQTQATERRAAGEIDEALALYAATLDSHASMTNTSNQAGPRHPPPPWAMLRLQPGPQPPPHRPDPMQRPGGRPPPPPPGRAHQRPLGR